MILECLIRRKIAKNYKVSNTKTNRKFFQKKKLVSDDSKLSNSARNAKKNFGGKMADFGGSCGSAAVFFQFYHQKCACYGVPKFF